MGSLQQIGPAADHAAPALVNVIDDPNPFGKWGAIFALKAIGPAASEALPALRREAEDPLPLTHVIAALIEILGDEGSRSERLTAATRVIADLGPEARSAIRALRRLQHHVDDRVRQVASEALTKLENESSTAI